VRGPVASATFDSGSWHLTATLLRTLRRWELKWLRKALRLRPAPDQGRQWYLQSTARKIEKWYSNLNQPMAHHIVLRNVFRSAWRETNTQVGAGATPLLELRKFRDRCFWNTVKQFPHQQRLREGLAQRTSGEKPAWEDPLIVAFGLRWRDLREGCQDKKHWRRHERDFINAICRDWKLPQLGSMRANTDAEEPFNFEQDRKKHKVQVGLPSCVDRLTITSECQSVNCGTAHFVVDCQPIANIMAGKVALSDEEHRPIFTRIGKNLARLTSVLDLGINALHDPIMWVERAKNQLADSLCNYTMDLGSSWRHSWEDPRGDKGTWSVIGFSDGGCRWGQCAAASWAIAMGTCQDETWSYRLVQAGGIFFEEPIGSFIAEAVALEEATKAAKEMCCPCLG